MTTQELWDTLTPEQRGIICLLADQELSGNLFKEIRAGGQHSFAYVLRCLDGTVRMASSPVFPDETSVHLGPLINQLFQDFLDFSATENHGESFQFERLFHFIATYQARS